MVEVPEARLRHAVPEVIATFPGDQTTPECNTMTYKD